MTIFMQFLINKFTVIS